MSENLPTNVQLEANASGTVSFAPEVIATIAGVATTEVDGVASLYAGSTGLAEMFSRKSSSAKALTKGVRVDFEENVVTVDVAIVVEYGMPIPDISLSVQENVKKAIETMSGLTVESVNVQVQGLSFERENQKALEEKKQQRIAAEMTEEAMEDTWEDIPVADVPDEEPASDGAVDAMPEEQADDATSEADDL